MLGTLLFLTLAVAPEPPALTDAQLDRIAQPIRSSDGAARLAAAERVARLGPDAYAALVARLRRPRQTTPEIFRKLFLEMWAQVPNWKGADPMWKKEVEEVYKTIKNEFAKVIRIEGILVLCNGVPAGVLSEYERNVSYVFAYLPDYDGPPVSLTMPLKKRSFSFDRFPPFFDAFLPEGVNYE